jgi:uncharacterized membrane protein YdbT with pleckstrin-like domain
MAEPVMVRRISPKAFLGQQVLAVLGGIVLAVILFSVGLGAWSPVAVLPILGVVAWAYIIRISDSYRLFEDRLELESGIVSRKIENVELFRIRDVGLRQGLVGRMLDIGDVYVHSTDSSTPDVHVRGIDDPREFYQILRDQVTASRAQNRTMIVEGTGPIAEL